MSDRSTLRWFGHVERMENKEFAKVYKYLSSVEGPRRRGRPLGRWEDRVKECMSERGVMGKWFGVSKEGMYGQGEVEVLLLWPPPWETLPERARRRSY